MENKTKISELPKHNIYCSASLWDALKVLAIDNHSKLSEYVASILTEHVKAMKPEHPSVRHIPNQARREKQ